MNKKSFRDLRTPAPQGVSYPTLDEFESGRREFLARLGATVLGAGGLAAALAGCGDRTVKHGQDTDLGRMAGVAPMPDVSVTAGEPPAPDAELDSYRDFGNIAGGKSGPDACVDNFQDLGGPSGVPRLPDAQADDVTHLGGAVQPPDARVDTRPSTPSGAAPYPLPDAGPGK